jgi:hypothetical protein
MNAAVAFYVARDVSAPHDRPRRPAPPGRSARRSRRRRVAGMTAVGVILFTGSLGGIAFATSGDDHTSAPSAAAGSSESEAPIARTGRAGPGYVAD